MLLWVLGAQFDQYIMMGVWICWVFSADKGRLNYLIVAGNAPLYKFGIKSATGGLFVAKTLDYEASDRVGLGVGLEGGRGSRVKSNQYVLIVRHRSIPLTTKVH